MADIFISYSRKNTSQLETLTERLREAGYSVWVDKHGIEGALNWSAEIVRAIDDCRTFILLLSQDSVASEYVMRELHLASQKKKNILPVAIDKVELPISFQFPLAGLHYTKWEDMQSVLTALRKLHSGYTVVEQMQARSPLTEEGITQASHLKSNSLDLAVLPFDDLSPAKDNEWFADGMMDELIYTLGSLQHLRVPSRSDVLYYRTNRPKPQVIANELDVRYLVEGSVRKAGEKIRITASLVDTTVQRQVWTNIFTGSFDDIFTFQESVSRQIAEALKLTLTTEENSRLTQFPTHKTEAYECFLRATEHYNHFTRAGFEKAVTQYSEAITIDPSYADAYLARANAVIAIFRAFTRDPNDLLRAEEDLAQAEKITGETAKTLRVAGLIAWQRHQLEEAETLLFKALTYDPHSVYVLNVLGAVYTEQEKYAESAEVFERGLRISPNTPTYFNLGGALTDAGNFEKRRKIAEEAIPYFLRKQSTVLYHINDTLTLGFFYHWSGRNEDALRVAKQILSADEADGFTLYNLFALFRGLNEPLHALEALRKAVDRGFRNIDLIKSVDIQGDASQSELEEVIERIESLISEEAVR